MRLIRIKLAGFKSFVDPVTFHVPGNLVGIVGPNGCGKSNLIDAVRWVMGESSARHLRGEAMADVIFNGSASRKPVGQASIELIFDNSDGRLGGAWARYGEISVRRVVNRDGQSGYFLNHGRCRRRDITEIFLGTGLGPRSYAIIEQGMISRVVEARPEELRGFIEEAAGISRYKERRRETEARLRETRENLDRLADLRQELAGQLRRLQRQAEAAERYRGLRQEARGLRAGLLALGWQRLDGDARRREQAIGQGETRLEAVTARQRGLESRLEAGREALVTLNAELGAVQARFYECGAEIARLEQSRQHRRELGKRQQEELDHAGQSLTACRQQLEVDRQRRQELESRLTGLEPELAAAREAEAGAAEARSRAEAALQAWQQESNELGDRAGGVQGAAEVERTRIEHLEAQLLAEQSRAGRLARELDALDVDAAKGELDAVVASEATARAALEDAQRDLTRVEERIARERREEGEAAAAVDELRGRLQDGRGRLSSLETLQEAALGPRDGTLAGWLQAQGLDDAPRLAEALEVSPGWDVAVEAVLGPWLEALCVPGLAALAGPAAALDRGRLCLFATQDGGEPGPREAGLGAQVEAPWPLGGLLAGVGVAVDLPDALARRGELGPAESLVTPQGVQVGRNWLRVTRDEDVRAGVLAREREIRGLGARLEADGRVLEERTGILQARRAERARLEASQRTLAAAAADAHRRHAHLQAQRLGLEQGLEQLRRRRVTVTGEIEELQGRVHQGTRELEAARERLGQALDAVADLAARRQALESRRQGLISTLEQCRARSRCAREEAQRLVLERGRVGAALDTLGQGLNRLEAQALQLEERCQALAAALEAGQAPGEAEAVRLQALLEGRVEVEQALAAARRRVQEHDTLLRELEHDRLASARQAEVQRDELESERLGAGETRARQAAVAEQLRSLGCEPGPVLATLEAGAEEAHWEARLAAVEQRIQRLGPVNLAAIDEHAELARREGYLEAQHTDLVQAVQTLEQAMGRIDRDTRTRFRETYQRIDAGLQALFPRLFGGGQAHLALTTDDPLDAGVAILARPPGKRIGHIQLLSGGEKALTAVALVFAIFRLNPAPFCLLDEVDAPLDEANVERFGALVQEMSEQVQFIFISHNKATMEIARHLTGVTMQEPGVSRLVTVDVDEAVKLAAV